MIVGGAGALMTGVYVVLLAAGQGRSSVAQLALIAPGVLAAEACAYRAITVRVQRPAWALLAAFCLAMTLGPMLVVADAGPLAVSGTPAPGLVVLALAYVLAIPAFVLLLRALRPWRMALSLDGIVVALGAGTALLFIVYGHQIDLVTTTWHYGCEAFYVSVGIVLMCLAGLAVGQSDWRPGPVWALLAAATVVLVAGDGIAAFEEYKGLPQAWGLALYPVALTLIALAAWMPAVHPPAPALPRPRVIVPTVAVLVALVVLAVAASRDGQYLPATIAAIVTLVVGIARGILAAQFNRSLLDSSRVEALTDNLTGLGNRRRLLLDLEQTIVVADRRPATLLFFDLDGFKGYNDSFGHAAGDALLARLGRALRAAVGAAGTAYRLGGDEFCVLLHGRHAVGTRLVDAARRGLTEHGDGFSVTASFGQVVLPDEATDVSHALQLADQRMYAAKVAIRASERSTARDLLLSLLPTHTREEVPGEQDVVGRAVAVGHQLGLGPDQLDVLARGAELHDIGKVAVPESILAKPGPLRDDEWAIMRRHTIIGERIVAATATLGPVAEVVRAVRERYDGTGYPDGLAGTEIPLESRIIAACDAYRAMRVDRNYASAVSEEVALQELRHNAGTQFDPQVVAALEAVVRRAPPELR